VKKKNSPPKILEIFLQSFLSPKDSESLLGDFNEMYGRISNERGVIRAFCWYFFHIIKLMPAYVESKIYWSVQMFKNYFKVAFRNLKKYKGYSFINIFGLATGLACSILVLLYVYNEISYDRFHEKADQIYRIYVTAKIDDRAIESLGTSAPLAKTLKDEYPEILETLRVSDYRETSSRKAIVHYDDNTFEENNAYAADPNFFDVFTFPLIKGNPKKVLAQPNTVVVTEATAQKYFGQNDPVGKILTIDGKECQITGIAENVPANSHFHFDFLISTRTYKWGNGTEWLSSRCLTYLVLAKEHSSESLEARFPEFVDKHLGAGGAKFHWSYKLQPLKDVHLHSNLKDEFEVNGNITYVYIFSIIAFLILIIASINFMNLTTAKYTSRIKEVGIRKVVGSTKEQLIKQFLSESILLSFISLFTALILVELLLRAFRNLLGLDFNINYFGNPFVIPCLAGLALLVGILSGSYPSFFLSSFKPVEILKTRNLPGVKSRSVLLRNWLIIFQFTVSALLIISIVVIYKQLRYIQNRNLGFEKEHVVVIKNIRLLKNQKEIFKDKLLQHPGIINASICSAVPSTHFNSWAIVPEGKTDDEWTTLRFCVCDHDYFNTLNIELVEGRFFSKDFGTDKSAAVLNQEAVKELGWKNPIGKKFKRGRNTHTVIGIIKDFHYESMHKKLQKMAMVLNSKSYKYFERYISVRVGSENIKNTLEYMNSVWKSFSPELPFDYSFLDQDLDNLYRSEEKTGNIFLLFAFIAVVIASLGLLGLVAFTVHKRTKEIGIRKILGANILNIVVLLVREFFILVVLSNFIAWPVGWYVMNKWLMNFAYKTNISIEVFLITGIFSLLIAIVTIGYQVIKAAYANPVDSLRYE